MVQRVLPLKNQRPEAARPAELVQAVGLRCDDSVVTIRFMREGRAWGEQARQVQLDRQLAQELSRLLADELDTL